MSYGKKTILVSFSNFLQILTTFVLGIVLARVLGKLEFGKFQQLLLIITFLTSLTNGVPLALSYYYGKLDTSLEIKLLFKRFFSLTILVSLVLALLAILILPNVASLFENDFFVSYSSILAGILFFKIANSYFLNFHLLIEKLKYFLFVKVVYFGWIIVSLWLLWINVFPLKTMFFLMFVIELINFLLFLRFQTTYGFSIKNVLKREEANYILYIALGGMAGIFNVYIDKFMISGMLMPEAYAEYQVGALTIPFIGVLTASVVTVLTPEFSRLFNNNKSNEIVTKWKSATEKVTFYIIPIFTFCIFFGPELISSIYSEKFEISGLIFQIYTAKNLLAVIIFGGVMGAIGLQRYLLFTQIINATLNIIANYFLIRNYGAVGAAIGTLIVTYLGYIIPIYAIKQKINAGFLDYFPLKSWLKTMMLSVVFSVLTKVLLESLSFKVNILLVAPIYYIIIMSIQKVLFKNLSFNIKKL